MFLLLGCFLLIIVLGVKAHIFLSEDIEVQGSVNNPARSAYRGGAGLTPQLLLFAFLAQVIDLMYVLRLFPDQCIRLANLSDLTE